MRKLLLIFFLSIVFLSASFIFDFSSTFDIEERVGEIIKGISLKREATSMDNKKIIEETNKQRMIYGLSPLEENSLLNSSALLKNEDMCREEYFEHVSPSGEEPGDIVKKTGYQFIVVAENLAKGSFSDEKSVVISWMESPGHRENILNEDYLEIGISAIRCSYKGNDLWMVTQHFAVSLLACPQVDESLIIKIDKINNEMAELYNQINQTSPQNREEYNRLVFQYNKLVSEADKLIDEYNYQVEIFNSCTESFN